jgi:hypothetical protein
MGDIDRDNTSNNVPFLAGFVRLQSCCRSQAAQREVEANLWPTSRRIKKTQTAIVDTRNPNAAE